MRFTVISLAFLLSTTLALPHTSLRRQDTSGPVISSNFQDPCVFQVDDTWYAFSGPNRNPSSGSPGSNVQVATSSDFSSWSVQTGVDSLPDPGAWAADPPHVWSPDVLQLGGCPAFNASEPFTDVLQSSGSFVMYYAASLASDPRFHCVGVATASSPTGPYSPSAQPVFCDTSIGGAIDPNVVTDPFTGQIYVAYKVDGNSIGNGGACSNSVAPIVSTPIILQEVSADDGVTLVGGSFQLITNEADDGAMVEAPALYYDGISGEWVLLYNSRCFTGLDYRIDRATSPSITGPYERQGTFLATGSTSANVQLPGGIDVAADGIHAVFHGDTNPGWFNGDGSARVRSLYAIAL